MRSPTRSTRPLGTSAPPSSSSSTRTTRRSGSPTWPRRSPAGRSRPSSILGGNPAYNAPADLDWATLQKSVPRVIRHGYYVDETSELAGTHIAAAHYLESWGDARTADGTIVPGPADDPAAVRRTDPDRGPGGASPDSRPRTRTSWSYETITAGSGARRRGHLPQVPARRRPRGHAPTAPLGVRLNRAALAQCLDSQGGARAVSAESLEVRFIADPRMDDGRFNNNGWLQECPDPITKISWDNAILISPRLAKELGHRRPGYAASRWRRKDLADFDKGRENAHIVELTVGGRKLRGPAHIQPGLANYTVVVPLGLRTHQGRAGSGRARASTPTPPAHDGRAPCGNRGHA